MQKGPWLRRGSWGARASELVRSVTCHSAITLMSSPTMNSRLLLALYHHSPFFHRILPSIDASTLFSPKLRGVGQILHLNTSLDPATVHFTRMLFSLISYEGELHHNQTPGHTLSEINNQYLHANPLIING